MGRIAQLAAAMVLVLCVGARSAHPQESAAQETIGVSDTVALDLQPVLTLSLTEGIAVGDAVQPSQAAWIVTTEAVLAEDSVDLSAPSPVPIQITEGILVGDAVGSVLSARLAVPEGVGVSDSVDVAALPPVVLQLTEAVGVGDSVRPAPAAWLALPELVGVADAADVATLPVVAVNVAEPVGVMDTAGSQLSVRLATPEPLQVADTASLDVLAVVDLHLAETVTVADAADTRPALLIQVAESVGVGDTAASLAAALVHTGETVVVVDSVDVSVPPVVEIHVAEPLSVADAVDTGAAVVFHVLESVRVTDSAGVLTADLGEALATTEGHEVHFGGGVSDVGQDPPTIAWTFGDGTSASGTLASRHVYADDGAYSLTLTVTGSGGASVRQSLDLLVSNVAPAVTAAADTTVDEGSPLTLAGAGFLDLGTLDTHSATIDWGDGLLSAGVVSESPFGPPGSTAGLSGSVSAGHVYGNDGVFPVTVTVVDDDGGAGAAGLVVTVRNVPPAAHDQSVTTREDVPVAVVLTGSDPGEDSLTFAVVEPPVHGSLSGAAPDLLYTPDPDFAGADDFTFQVGDGEAQSAPATVAISVSPDDDPPVVSLSPEAQVVQYSDRIEPIVVRAQDVDSSGLGISALGLPDDLAAGPGECVAEGHGVSCAWTIQGPVAVRSEERQITITVSDASSAVDGVARLDVDAEDAAIDFDESNPVGVAVATSGGPSGEFVLAARMQEASPDRPEATAAPGDLERAEAAMRLLPVGPGVPVVPLGACGRTVTGTGYDAVLLLTCSFAQVPANVYAVAVAVSGGFYAGEAEDSLVVYDPSGGATRGGGWFQWPGSTDSPGCDSRSRTTFAFTMSYGKKGSEARGNLVVVSHRPDGSAYRIKSNAVDSLVVGEAEDPSGQRFGWALFGGKATYRGPGWPEPLGNHRFLVYVEDRGEPGAGSDRFWIEVRDRAGRLVDALSMPRETFVNAVPLRGGNIQVPLRGQKRP